MPDSPAILTVRDLVRHFGAVKAVDGVSFSLAPGQSAGPIGANGAGKTTIMRMLTTLDTPDRGSITYKGTDVVAEPVKVRRELGWMPDSFAPPAHTTVHEFMDFYARAYGLTGDTRVGEVRRVLEFCGVADLARRHVNALSKGQTQKILLARMLVGNPQLLVMDEPAAGLDPQARVELKQLVADLRRQGKTLLISSHILTELAEMCDFMIFMDHGKVISQGSQDELARREGGVRVQMRAADAAALAAELRESGAWRDVAELPGGMLDARFTAEGDEALALELRRLCASHLITDFHRRAQKLEETFVNVLKQQHE